MRRGIIFVPFALLLCSFAFSASVASAQTVCPLPGERPALSTDAAVQLGHIKVGVCYNPATAVGIDQTAEEAKQYLKSLPCPSGKCYIENINNSFAVCAANFFKEFQQRYGRVTINRAWNSVENEARLCRNNPGCGGFMNSPAPQSNHTKGVAMDVSAGNHQITMANFAKQNPQFGVCFPFVGSSFKDDVHMILAGIPGSEPRVVGCAGVVRACEAGKFDPNSIVASNPALSPTSAIANQIRQALGLSQPPPPPPPAAAPIQQQPLSQSEQQPLQNAYETPASQTLTPTDVQSTPVSVSTLLTTTPINVNTNINGRTEATSSTSTIDLLSAFINPYTSTSMEIGTSSPISLILAALEDVATLGATSSATSSRNATGTILAAQGINSQQTFTSADLSTSVGDPRSTNTLAQILTNIQSVLRTILQYLRPFGRADNGGATEDEVVWY